MTCPGCIWTASRRMQKDSRIGCMVTLRELEVHEGLKGTFGNIFKEAVRHIVGVQFRNLATVGGSIFPRFGFSDVLTAFMSCDSYVEAVSGRTDPHPGVRRDAA